MEDNNGTLQFTCLTQHIQQPPYLLIDQVDHSVICRLYDLVVVLAHFIKDDCRIVGVVIVVGSLMVHLLEQRFVAQFARMVVRHRQLVQVVNVSIQIFFWWIKGMVRVIIVDREKPIIAILSVCTDKIDCFVGAPLGLVMLLIHTVLHQPGARNRSGRKTHSLLT